MEICHLLLLRAVQNVAADYDLYVPRVSDCVPLYCGLHMTHSSATCDTVLAADMLKNEKLYRYRIWIRSILQTTRTENHLMLSNIFQITNLDKGSTSNKSSFDRRFSVTPS